MGIGIGLKNLDEVFASTPGQPTILNYVPTVLETDLIGADGLTFTTYDGQSEIRNEPSCTCGKHRGGYKLGIICDECGTEVSEVFTSSLESRVWITTPQGVNSLFNPLALLMLSSEKLLKVAEFSYIRWMCDITYNNPKKAAELELDVLLDQGVCRGYNNFVANFDHYMELLIHHILIRKGSKRQPRDASGRLILDERQQSLLDLMEVIKMHRGAIFPSKLPIPNKSLVILETSSSATYVDTVLTGLIDVIKTVRGIDTEASHLTNKQRENRTCKAMFQLAAFYDEYFKKVLGGKPGIFRRHLYGTRNGYSIRGVISSNTKPHEYDTLIIPWAAALNLFKVHLTALMQKDGFTVNEMLARLQRGAYHFDEYLDGLMQKLFNGTRDGWFYAYWNRNPSLKRGSTERFRIIGWKKDINDPTITSPIMAVVGFNCDFDGDQMNMVLAIDNWTADQMAPLDPHMNVFSDDVPRTFSGMVSIPKPVIATQMNWYQSERQRPVTQKDVDFLQSLAL